MQNLNWITVKPVSIIVIAVVCSVIAVFAVLGGIELYKEHEIEKYSQFMIKANSLESSYKDDVNRCVNSNLWAYDKCIDGVLGNFKVDFKKLVLDFGYEDRFQRLYDIWTPTLVLAANLKRIDIEYSGYSFYRVESAPRTPEEMSKK